MSDPPDATPRRGLGIRTLLLVGMGAAVVYFVAAWLYLAAAVSDARDVLGRESAPVLDLLTDLQERARALEGAVVAAREIPSGAAARRRVARNVRALMGRAGPRTSAVSFGQVSPAVAMTLAQADDDIARLQHLLAEFAALLDLDRLAEARERRLEADSTLGALGREMGQAHLIALQSFLVREQALSRDTERAVRVVGAWLTLGIVGVAVALVLLRRRLERPLRELEHGLARVGAGELSTRVPVRRRDELGRLAELFNEMARLLHARAEQQGRYAAAGELLAGVAHEVNNPLMAIASLAELRLADPALPDELRDELDQMRTQARRAARLLSGLLRFVRPSGEGVAPADLNGALERALDLLTYRLSVEDVTVERACDPRLPAVRCDATRMEQVFVHLLSNALDALRAVRPPRRLLVRTWSAAERVYAAVSDNGPGLPDEVRRRLFAPFVSGKPDGAGLGLYMSRQIVREAGGELVYQPGGSRGATFVVRLPAAAVQPVAGRPAPAADVARPAPLAGLTVLVVDDEEAIRRVIALYLRRRGARVATAADGGEALGEIARALPDLVLADLRMPGVNGIALYQALEREHPTLTPRVVFLSGDITQLTELGQDHGVPPERILAKPIDLADLEERILRVVGRT